jgi:hypothetical protein
MSAFALEQAAHFYVRVAQILSDPECVRRDLDWMALTALDHAIALEAEIERDRAQAPHYDHQVPHYDKYRCVCPDGHSLTIDGGIG